MGFGDVVVKKKSASELSESDRRKTLRQVAVGLAIVCVIAVSATLREQTADAESDSDSLTARARICFSPSTNDIEGDISPGNMRFSRIGKVHTDDDDKYATFLDQALPRLQAHGADIEPNYYVTFSAFFDFNKGGARQFAAAIICEKNFGSADNPCRNRSYLSYSNNEPAALADVIADDILRFEPLIRNCSSPN